MVKCIEKICKIVLYFVKTILKKGGDLIKRLQPRRKAWLENRNRKLQLKITKYNKSKKNKKIAKPRLKRTANNQYTAIAPENFSLIHNTEETLYFFNNILKNMRLYSFDRTYFFDLKSVKYITTDAIMCILAIIRNMKNAKIYRYRFQGNLPENKEARVLIEESGFFSYVHSANENLERNSCKIQIKSGNTVDPSVAKDICDFINQKFNTSIKFTMPIFETLMELMQNTVQHAYQSKNGRIAHEWYIFVEEDNHRIIFTFLDSGEGIPSTVNKKLLENLGFKNDSELILSAMKGDFLRSTTKEKYRGNGLPLIYKYAQESKLFNLRAYSGKGCCIVDSRLEQNSLLKDLLYDFFGTLFYWEIHRPA